MNSGSTKIVCKLNLIGITSSYCEIQSADVLLHRLASMYINNDVAGTILKITIRDAPYHDSRSIVLTVIRLFCFEMKYIFELCALARSFMK